MKYIFLLAGCAALILAACSKGGSNLVPSPPVVIDTTTLHPPPGTDTTGQGSDTTETGNPDTAEHNIITKVIVVTTGFNLIDKNIDTSVFRAGTPSLLANSYIGLDSRLGSRIHVTFHSSDHNPIIRKRGESDYLVTYNDIWKPAILHQPELKDTAGHAGWTLEGLDRTINGCNRLKVILGYVSAEYESGNITLAVAYTDDYSVTDSLIRASFSARGYAFDRNYKW